MVEDKQSGLLIPEGSRELKERTWLDDGEPMKTLRRLQKLMVKGEEKVKLMLVCETCGQPLQFVEQEFSSHAKLVCQCTERVIH